MHVEVEDRVTVTNLLDLSKFSNNNISQKSILKQPHSLPNTNNSNNKLVKTSIDENLSRTFVNSSPNTNIQRTNMNQDHDPGMQSHTIRMERPKSAKHNLERLKKSIYLKRTQNRNATSSSTANYRPHDDGMIFDRNDENEENSETDQEMRQYKEQRMKASKSAFAVRPKSARHNLQKYRQDVINEKQEKIESLKKRPRQNEDMESDSILIENVKDLQRIEKNDMNENIDSLDGLLIREEDDDSSSDEINSQNSLNDPLPPSYPAKKTNKTNINVKNTQKSRTNTQQKQQLLNRNNNIQKLLNRRNIRGEINNNEEQLNKTIASINNNTNNNNIPNNKEHNYTTFGGTAITYTPPNHENNSILVAQKLKQQHQDLDELASHGDNVATNSSSSSSTSSQQLSSTNLAICGLKQDCLHLNRSEDGVIPSENAAVSNLNDILSKKLLNEWYRNDEEVELTIEKLNDLETQAIRNNFARYEPLNNVGVSTIRSATTNNTSNQAHSNPTKQKNSGTRNQSQQMMNKSQQQQIVILNTNGRNSRLSDFSSTTKQKNSVNNINLNNNNANGSTLNAANLSNHQNYLVREKSCNSMDPWTRRNPSQVAQNVLTKHRTELEQLHNTRFNNTSRQSNNKTNNILTNTNKHLLPDTKYYKNSNNY